MTVGQILLPLASLKTYILYLFEYYILSNLTGIFMNPIMNSISIRLASIIIFGESNLIYHRSVLKKKYGTCIRKFLSISLITCDHIMYDAFYCSTYSTASIL